MSEINMGDVVLADDDAIIDGAADELDEVEYFGEKEARWFQIAAKNGVVAALRQHIRRILIKQPTGSGKTLTIGLTMNSPQLHEVLNIPKDRKIRVLFIAHKHRLLTQAERTFAAENGVELILQSCFSDIPASVIEKGWDIAVIDEAHHEAMATIQYQLDHIGDRPIIGLTATDQRADGSVIKFETIIEPITREQAVAENYLAETRLHSIVDPTSSNKTDITESVLREFHEEFGQTMMFFKTTKEAEAIHAVLLDLGKKSVLISKQNERLVNQALDQFSAGEIQFIVNCNKINEGIDVAGCTDVFLGRQYGSYAQLNQVIGRAARPDSECNVWELINPLSAKNLDTTVIVGTPAMHRLMHKRAGKWLQAEFDYQSTVLAMPPSRGRAFGQ